jgi:hypothetical protein
MDLDPFALLHQFSRRLARKIVSRFEKTKADECPADAPVLGRYFKEAYCTPLNENRIAEKRHFTKPVEYYAEMHRTAVSLFDNSAAPGDAQLIGGCRVHAEWGLIYAGAAAVPYALRMLQSKIPEARADGAAILAALGDNEQTFDSLLQAFEKDYRYHVNGAIEKESVQALESIIEALGRLRNKKAIPALAKVVRNSAIDGDTRWTAMENLGRLARHRFDKNTDPMSAAVEWLQTHGF